MTCTNDYSILREVVVGRADYKPVHLHDEPATRKKLDVAFAKNQLTQSQDTRDKNNTVVKNKAAWREELRKLNAEKLINDPYQRHAKCVQQVDNFVQILRDNNCNVLRPDIVPGWESPANTPWWETSYQYGTPCPRDLFIKFGDLLVETYSGWRCRYFESEAYYGILEDHCERTDSRYVKMPRGVLSDELYPGYGKVFQAENDVNMIQQPQAQFTPDTAFTEHCAIIEAADIRRFDNHVFMQTGGYSNEKGFKWLQRLLKKENIQLHKMTFDSKNTSYYHLDAKFSAIDDSTILYSPDPEHKPHQEIFNYFKDELDFNLIEAPKRMVLVSPDDFTSSGLNLNWLVLEPRKIVLDEGEKDTVKFLRDELGCDCVTIDFSNAFEFGGAFNCWTLDLVRG